MFPKFASGVNKRNESFNVMFMDSQRRFQDGKSAHELMNCTFGCFGECLPEERISSNNARRLSKESKKIEIEDFEKNKKRGGWKRKRDEDQHEDYKEF